VTPPAAPADRTHDVELVVLTGAKVVSNTAIRWVGPFLPTLERAFGTTTGTLTGVMGACELGGLGTLATGPLLDRGHERRIFVLGLLAVAASSAIALGGTVTTFAISFSFLVLGVSNLTTAGHAWIGHRIAFAARGRSIGLFETSWAVALLVGAPVLALLIRWFGWRGPYVALIVGCLLAATAVQMFVTGAPLAGTGGTTADQLRRPPLPRSEWAPMLASAATAAAGLGTFVVSGAWLDERYGLSTGGLGLVAAAFGAVELASSGSVAAFGDRVGARRSVIIGLVVLGTGLATMFLAGSSRAVAICSLLIFLTGFEYAFVSSLTLVTEAAPAARGRAIGISNSLGTVARASAVVVSGQLYEAFGIGGSVVFAAAAAACALVAALVSST
jgi:DHA1 family inner membrane transport protein